MHRPGQLYSRHIVLTISNLQKIVPRSRAHASTYSNLLSELSAGGLERLPRSSIYSKTLIVTMSYHLRRKLQRHPRSRSTDLEDQLRDNDHADANVSTSSPMSRRRLKTDKTPPEMEEMPSTAEKSVEDKTVLLQRERALKALEDATDVQSAYAALKIVKEVFRLDPSKVDDDDPTQQLIKKASLAVPFLMYKLAVERFTRPRSFGGLAFSIAKAKRVAATLFQNMGPSCCSTSVTEKDLVKAGQIEITDARKVLPLMKDVGIETRAKVEAVRKLVMDDVDEAL
jgi:hypothetical protein